MKKFSFVLFFLCNVLITKAQVTGNTEQFPVFPNCQNITANKSEACFYNTIQDFFFENFKVPEVSQKEKYSGTVVALFETDTLGNFSIIYIDAVNEDLKKETKRVFGLLPNVSSATYSGRKVYSKFTIKIPIPLQKPIPYSSGEVLQAQDKTNSKLIDNSKELTEFEDVAKNYKAFENPQYKSNLNVAFSHLNYANFDALMNQVGSNNHTATKPYSYAEVSKYYDFEIANQMLLKQKTSYLGRKIWNENLVAIQGDGYWFTMNPILDLRMGKDTESALSNTFVNTRGLQIQGALGEQLSFSASIFESQGRFADYYNSDIPHLEILFN